MSIRLTESIETLISETGEEIGEEVVPATPVDTGFARGNWRPSLDVPAALPVTRTDPTGASTVSQIAVVSRQYRIGNTIYITNNAPYIESLNQGSSPQAPAGFVRAAVQRATQRVFARFAGGLIRRGN